MEYGSAYIPRRRNPDDDEVSLPSEQRFSQYRPYRPGNHQPPVEPSVSPASYNVSPVALSQSLPPGSGLDSPYISLGPSVFATSAVLDTPYQEPTAWEQSTQFRSTRPPSPKPELQPTVSIRPESATQHESRQYFRHPRHSHEKWKTGFWIRFPWRGFSALILVLLLTGVSAGILLASDGDTLERWRIGKDNAQPPVYISVIDMVINLLILFALADGMVIMFWRRLLHGCTLSTMHDIYESASLLPAAKRIARLQFNTAAVACVLAFTSAARGPLFQRALIIHENGTSTAERSIDLKIAPFPLPEYFQSTTTDPRSQLGTTVGFARALRDVSAGNSPAYEQPPECGAHCNGTAKGFAFKVNCSTSSQPYGLFNPDKKFRTLFAVGYEKQGQTMTLTGAYKDQPTCQGDVQIHTCSLTQVTTDYDFMITNNTASRLPTNPDARIYDDSMVLDGALMGEYWPLALDSLFPSVAINMTLSGDNSRLEYKKCIKDPQENNNSGNGVVSQDGSHTLSACSDGKPLQVSLLANDPSVVYATQEQGKAGDDPQCALTWRDPMQDMIEKMQSLAFYITVDMANSNSTTLAGKRKSQDWTQTIPVTTTHTRTTYSTSTAFVTVGIVLSILGVIGILPLYMGFWELGRTVSLNPLEIARAFGAPLMVGLDGNTTPDMICFERGGMSIRYGALERYGEEKKLRVDETSRTTVRVPWHNEVFG